MSKSNRDAAKTMGGNVLEEQMRLAKAAWDAPAGRDQIICSPGQADKMRDLLALAADASDSTKAQQGAPLRGGPPTVTVSDSPRAGYTIRINIGDRMIAEAARRITGKQDAEEVVKALLGAYHETMRLRAEVAAPAGRWTAHHPDPATKARIEADLNATGGSFTVPKEPGVFTIRHTVHSTSTPLVNPTNEEAERAFGKHSWAADAVKWANARLPGEMAAIEAIADRMGVELCNPATPALEHVTGASPNYTTNTFLGTAADLRRLHDAIGQAIETGAARIESYRGGPVTITRDEMLFSPTVTMDAPGGLPATVAIAADAKHLRLLRDAVDEARATGKAPPRDWGKRRKVAVERVGEAPTVAEPPSEAEPVRYDGGHGGAQAWRWEVGE